MKDTLIAPPSQEKKTMLYSTILVAELFTVVCRNFWTIFPRLYEFLLYVFEVFIIDSSLPFKAF